MNADSSVSKDAWLPTEVKQLVLISKRELRVGVGQPKMQPPPSTELQENVEMESNVAWRRWKIALPRSIALVGKQVPCGYCQALQVTRQKFQMRAGTLKW